MLEHDGTTHLLVETPTPAPEPEVPGGSEEESLAALIRAAGTQLQSFGQMPQNPLTLEAKLNPRKEAKLRALLDEIHQEGARSTVLPFASLEHVHFARLLIVPGEREPEEYDSSLFFLAEVDGPVDAILDQLLERFTAGLDAVFSACRDYPAQCRRTRETRRTFLQAHLISTQAWYVNTLGRSVRQIQQEDMLYRRLEAFLNQFKASPGLSARAVRKAMINHVKAEPDLNWALLPREAPPLSWRLWERARFAGLAALGGVVLFWSWPLLAVWIINLQRQEQGDPEDLRRPDLSRLEQLRSQEDFAVHNQFSAVGQVKPGWVRLTTARAILAAAQVALRHVFNRGDLAGVPLLGLDGVDTIHFARWVMIDDGRRLLFASNYDGSLESYMVDFVDKVAWGLNIVFSNGVGYPRTNWLVFNGARNEQRFKDYLGNHQLESQVWYTAYPHLTAVNIANNEAIREGLQGDMSDRQARRWLQRF